MAEILHVWPLFATMASVVAILALSAFLVHPYRREMMAVGEEILSYTSLSKQERDGVEMMLDTATSPFTGFALLLAPIVGLFDSIANNPKVEVRFHGVPIEKVGRLMTLAVISAFAANPFIGVLWLPIHVVILGAFALFHIPIKEPVMKAIGHSIQLKRAVHL